MNVRVGIVTNPLDPRSWEDHEVADVRELLMRRFPSWPSTARIYDLEGFDKWQRAAALTDPRILATRDVTPTSEQGIERLGRLPGPLLVTIPPADPITAIIAVVAVVVGIAAAFLLMPKIPGAQRSPSPNNALAERTNQARPNGRISDIFGTVESTPDLLAVPYSVFENNKEIEQSYMGVGRGSYAVSRVRDGDTSIASIAGSSAAIYGPFTSPNSGDAPELQIGAPIAEPVKSVLKLNEVNGQTLNPTNLNFVQGDDSIRFVYPDTIESIDPDINFTDFFSAMDALSVEQADIEGSAGVMTTTADARFTSAGEIEFQTFDPSTVFSAGQFVTLPSAAYAGDNGAGGVLYISLVGTYEIASVTATKVILDDPAAINSDWDKIGDYPADRTEYGSQTLTLPDASAGINLNGNYTALAVSADSIQLNNPALVNASWNNLDDLPGGATDYVSPVISRSSESWIGPYIIDLDDTTEVYANIVGLNGLYTISKKKGKQSAMLVGVTLELTPINNNDSAVGPAELFPDTVIGSDTEKTSVGITIRATPTFTGRCSVRLRRTSPTPKDDDYGGIVDEIKWRDCYGLAPVAATEFGDITTVMTRTIATPGALSLKSRKLNMRVTRKVPEYLGDGNFGALVASDSAADIIAAMCLDPYIGRRSAEEVDFENIYQTIAEVEAYFGNELATHFGYTFDDVDVSFEEAIQTVAQAVFCNAYRQGRVIKLTFERATEASSLIFNARNTIPRSQRRTQRFGPLDDHDGVELDYIDPTDGAQLTYSIPIDGTATSARSIEIVGVRSYVLAYWQAWRAWNKVQHQNLAVELEATQEAALIIPADRILIADMTRPNLLQGDVLDEAGTTLEISEPADLDPDLNWTIFLQHVDGTTEPLGVVPGDDPYHVELSAPPRLPLSIDAANFARATYMIVPEGDVQTRAFLLTEREPNSDFTETVKAVNYTFLYYQNDELVLWLEFAGLNFYDSGPYLRDGLAAGGATVIVDAQRGYALNGTGAGSRLTFPVFTQPTSYTKAVWLKRNDQTTAGSILGGAHEVFGFSAGADLRGGHDSIAVSAPWPAANEWHHAALTYDADDGEMVLYIDGMPVDSADAVPARVIVQLVGFDGFLGRGDELKLWKRALLPNEILAVYRSSRGA